MEDCETGFFESAFMDGWRGVLWEVGDDLEECGWWEEG